MTYLIPEQLETQRLILRMPKLGDFNDIHEYYSDPECTVYTTRRPLNESESWQKLAALAGHWVLRGYGSYVLQEKDQNRVIGIAGLDYPNDWPEPEIQWGLARKYWGKGYASEAARAIKEMAANHLPGLSLISLIHPQNQNSIKLANSLGAYFEREHYFRDDNWYIFRHV
jgi:RimJ/RimL family protein N-acetyltransferase